MPRISRLVPPVALLLAGCTIGGRYQAPQPKLPETYGAVRGAGQDTVTLDRWWTIFGDQELASLIARALQQNRDLKLALSRVREARSERAVVAGGLIPQVDATGGYNRSHGSNNVVLPLGGTSSASGGGGGSAGATPAVAAAPGGLVHDAEGASAQPAAASQAAAQPGGPNSPFGLGGLPGATTNLYQVGFDAVWELDIFGGVRRSIEAADATAAAAVEGGRGVRISLLAEVAVEYVQLRAAQARERVARANLETQRKSWRLAQDKWEGGVGSETETAQAAALWHNTEATLPSIVAQEKASRHALAFLIGEQPDALDRELAPARALPALPPDVPLGVPSDLLRRRPDIRQAERQVAASFANLGVARAQLFPQFSVTGAFGLDSSTVKQLPEWSSHYYSIAPGIRWPILDWNRLHAGIRVENEAQAQALISYDNAVAQALRDVADALVKYQAEKDRHRALALALAESRRAQRTALQTFEAGLADQVASLEATKVMLQAEDQLTQSDALLRTDVIALYKALGGGWDAPLPD